MKKLLMMFIAAAAMTLAACGNKEKTVAASEEATDTVPEGYTVYDTPTFSVACPEVLYKTEAWGEEEGRALNFSSKKNDSNLYFGLSLNYATGDTSGGAAEAAQNMKYSMQAQDWECDEPKVEGRIATMRCTKTFVDETDQKPFKEIKTVFCVIGNDSKYLNGDITYNEAEADFYAPMVMPIIKSIQIK
jgi:hypothetical protein